MRPQLLHCAAATGIALLVACGPTNDHNDAPDLDDPDFDAFVAAYGELVTVAGRGAISAKDVNGWQTRFEGGPATQAELSRPHIAMADAQGRIFIADKDAHAVRRVDPDGRIYTVAGTNQAGNDGDGPAPAHTQRLNYPNGLWVQPDGRLFILDRDNDRVCRVDPDGTMRTLFAIPQSLSTGRGLWVSASEDLAYVAAGTSVLVWQAGLGVRTFASGFVDLGNLVVLANGAVILTDRGANRVYRLDFQGRPEPIAGNGLDWGGGSGKVALGTALVGVRGVWPLPSGALLLATHEGSQVWYLDPSGLIYLLIDGEGGAHAGDGQSLASPGKKVSEVRAITVAPQGDLIITEHDAGYIRVVRRR